jgi:predicted secreted protein
VSEAYVGYWGVCQRGMHDMRVACTPSRDAAKESANYEIFLLDLARVAGRHGSRTLCSNAGDTMLGVAQREKQATSTACCGSVGKTPQ